jgi:hypothetical protein
MAEQGTRWNSELDILMKDDNLAVDKVATKLALARMVKYCEAEAHESSLPFVAYCLSLALGALAEQVDDLDGGWSTEPRLRRGGD